MNNENKNENNIENMSICNINKSKYNMADNIYNDINESVYNNLNETTNQVIIDISSNNISSHDDSQNKANYEVPYYSKLNKKKRVSYNESIEIRDNDNTDNSLVFVPTQTYELVKPNYKNILYNNKSKSLGTPSLNQMIINDHLRPVIVNDIRERLHGRKLWDKISNNTTVISKIMMIFVSIFAFAGSKFTEMWWFAFVAGILGVSALSLMQFSMFARTRSKNFTNDLNMLLQTLHLEKNKLPNLQQNESEEYQNNS